MKLGNMRTYLLAFLLALVPITGLAADGRTLAAERAAVDWLALVDRTQYGVAWSEAAFVFRSQISALDWLKAAAEARNPLGGVITRNSISAIYATNLPDAPDGEYVVLQFQTDFENSVKAIETVTSMLDEGQWKVAGYYVR